MSAFLPESDSEDELPPGWEERATLQGEVYYANHDQSSTQWQHPRTGRRKTVGENLPFGWERKILEDNKVVYVDLVNKKTTFTDPRLAFAKETVTASTTFRQKFDSGSTALQVAHGRDLTGQVALITGANSGVGWQTARTLALQGCQVVLACRSEAEAGSKLAMLKTERANVQASFLHLDLASLTSVQRAARQFLLFYTKLDFLVLNAGTFPQDYSLTEDGLEMMMQVNFLSHLYLASLLTPALSKATSSRIAVLSSESHRFCPTLLPTSLLFSPGPIDFSAQVQYNKSKLCCLLLAPLLNRHLEKIGVTALAVHPGNLLPSYLHRHSWLYWAAANLLRPWTKSLAQAAASVVMALLGEEFPKGTIYINNCFPTQPENTVSDWKTQDAIWDAALECLEQKMGKDCCSGAEGGHSR